MAKARAKKRAQQQAGPRLSRRLSVVLVLAALVGGALVVGRGLLAQRQRGAAPEAAVSPSGLSPSQPTKEYIYAGGRLVATEEPAGNPPPAPPVPPTGLTATAGNAQVVLAWSGVAGATSYNVKRSTASGGPFGLVASVAATSHTDTGLTNGTTYFYVVTAVNSAGESGPSTVASATPLAGGTAPAAPSGLTASAVSSSQINLSWTDNSTNETNFEIHRKTGAGGSYSLVAMVGAGVTSFSNTGLSASTTYFYRVRAISGTGASAYSNEANATTAGGGGGLAAPTNLRVTSLVTTTGIQIAWDYPIFSGFTGFKIERKTGAGGTYSQVATASASSRQTTVKNLTPGTTYFFRVRAYDANGDSPYSNEVSGTTLTAWLQAPGAAPTEQVIARLVYEAPAEIFSADPAARQISKSPAKGHLFRGAMIGTGGPLFRPGESIQLGLSRRDAVGAARSRKELSLCMG